MTYDINMIKDFYASYAQKVNMIRSKSWPSANLCRKGAFLACKFRRGQL